jgi:6-phosphogluconolactonase
LTERDAITKIIVNGGKHDSGVGAPNMVDLLASTLMICESPNVLALRAAESIAEIAREALAACGRFTLALCGGSTPEKTYSSLARPEQSAAIDWSKTYIFFGDERFVPHGDPNSNFRMAQKSLLLHVPIPALHVFPVPTEWSSAAKAAEAYARELSNFFQESEPGRPRPRQSPRRVAGDIPRFDLILLGLGEDGHTASLFPGSAALKVEDALVTWSLPGSLPPPVDRITFTYPLINAARNVMFLATGPQKAAILHDVLEGSAGREIYPAVGVQPHDGRLMWFIDRSAAKSLTPCFIAAQRGQPFKND